MECPALKEALPADDAGNSTWRSLGEPREVLFGDGSWHPVTVIACWRNRNGDLVVQLQWSARLTMWTGEYIADPSSIREAREA
jgi:hypothetical protein